MTYEDAIEDAEPMCVVAARRELRRHSARIIGQRGVAEGPEGAVWPDGWPAEILVTNDIDEADWIACTPAAVLGWLGY